VFAFGQAIGSGAGRKSDRPSSLHYVRLQTTEAAVTFRISGKNLDIGEALRQRINARIGEAMSKYFDGGYSGHVTVAREGTGFRTECALHLDSKITLHAQASAPDAYLSADQAALRVEERLRRYHRRRKDHRPRSGGPEAV
jgi:ribosomal subunit interface protein